ncbi:MAG: WbqC family protein [Salinibacter sp.]
MIAVRPPEYFPRLAYMALVQQVDHFVLADTFPHRRQSFQNRSKLRNAPGWHWITIPLFGQREGAPIQEVDIKTEGRWQEKHWRSFLYDYRTTMYFEFYEDTFRPFFEHTWTRLAPCVCRSVNVLTELLDLRTTVTRASALAGTPSTLSGIVEATGAEILVGTQGDVSSSMPVEGRAADYDHPTYRQNFEDFEAGMTAADLVFNYGREAPRILAEGLTVSTPETGSR